VRLTYNGNFITVALRRGEAAVGNPDECAPASCSPLSSTLADKACLLAKRNGGLTLPPKLAQLASGAVCKAYGRPIRASQGP